MVIRVSHNSSILPFEPYCIYGKNDVLRNMKNKITIRRNDYIFHFIDDAKCHTVPTPRLFLLSSFFATWT